MSQLTIGLIGDGRVARHMGHYFSKLGIPLLRWSRKVGEYSQTPPTQTLKNADIIALAVSDSGIEDVLKTYPQLLEKKVIHFSGCLSTPLAQGFHPLMTFGEDLYELSFYKRIPFVVEKGKLKFKNIFPSLENPNFEIKSEEKPFYHAMCVLSGNFTTILWNKFFREMETRYGIPNNVSKAYLFRITENLKENPEQALTGPLQRNDLKTIETNLHALENDPFRDVYEAMVRAVQKQGDPS